MLERLHFMLLCMGHVRDGMRALRMGWAPRRDVAIDVHHDWFAVVLNGVRVLVALGIVTVLAIWSGIADTATAILFTAVFVSLGAVQPDPNVMGRTALLGMPAVAIAGTFYSFFLFPQPQRLSRSSSSRWRRWWWRYAGSSRSAWVAPD